MADEGNQNKQDKGSNDPNKKNDFQKVSDKYNELKKDPKIKATGSLFANYFVEIFYLVAALISFIYSLVHSPRGAVVFIGIGFLLGLFLFSIMKNATNSVSSFLKKQELVVHIILAIIAIILAFIIPTIMMGILFGIPAGFGVRHGIFEARERYKHKRNEHLEHHDHKDHHDHHNG